MEDVLSVVDASDSDVAAGMAHCMRLRQSILKWAFEGKLVDQDPNDKSAAELLQRDETAAIRHGSHK